MQDGSLSNKANPFLAGLTGLGEGLLQGYLAKMKMNQEQDEFNRKMAMEERQNSFMNMFKQKDYELNLMQEQRLSRPPEKKAFLDSYKEGYTTEDPITKLPVFHPFENKSVEQPEYTTTTVPDSKTGKEKTYSHIKDTEFGSSSWKLIGDKPIYKPETTKETDFSEPGLVGEIEGTFATLKGMSEDADDQTKAPLKANLIAKTEALMESAGLTSDVGHIWDIVKQGGDVEKAINVSALARKKSYTPKQREYLRLYFRTRFIPQEKK